MLTILAGVTEFEREIIRERPLAGVRAAKARSAAIGRPKRVFRHDEVVRLQDGERLSWRVIAARLGVPVSTARDAYECAKTVPSESATVGIEGKEI
jgi:DNA invertase Pin-like site-specific DNA recombinase